MRTPFSSLSLIVLILFSCAEASNKRPVESSKFSDLEDLFLRWRDFESPPMKDGAPDYSKERFELRMPEFKKLPR